MGAKEGTLATNYSGNTGACGDSVEAPGRRPDCGISVRSLRDRAACLAAVCQATERQQRRWGGLGGGGWGSGGEACIPHGGSARLGPISGGVVCLSPGPMMRCCAGRRPSSLSAPSSRRLLSLPAFPQAPRRLFTGRKYDRLYVNLTVCLRERAPRRDDGGGWRRVSRARASVSRDFRERCGAVRFVREVDAPTLATCATRYEKEKKMFNFQTNVNLTAFALLLLPLKEETATDPCWKTRFCSRRAPCEAFYSASWSESILQIILISIWPHIILLPAVNPR